MNTSMSLLKLLRLATLAGLIIWAAISLGRLFQESFSATGGNDLYTYWYAGHFIREGKDFYRSFINNELPSVPVRYLDGEVDSLDGIIFQSLVPAPASTAPVFFLMAPLAFFSWPVAKAIWLVLNLVLLGAIPFIIVRLLPKKDRLTRWEFLAFLLAVIGLTSTRYAAASGQITFLILDLLLAALLLAERKQWIAGILLGLALSKYSLSLGVLILFLVIEPKPRLVITAIVVQITGIIGLMLMSGSGFLEIIAEYAQMAFWHAGREGIHLAAALHGEQYYIWIALALTIAVGIPLAIWRWKNGRHRMGQALSVLSQYHLGVISVLWALLVGYHRAYDAMVVIIFFGLIAYLVKQPEAWILKRKLQTGLEVFTTIALLLLMVPSGSIVRGLLPQALEIFWGEAVNMVTTLLISAFLILTIFLLFRVREEKEVGVST